MRATYIGVYLPIQGDFCKSTPPKGRHTILIYFSILYETRNFSVLKEEIKYVYSKFVVM